MESIVAVILQKTPQSPLLTSAIPKPTPMDTSSSLSSMETLARSVMDSHNLEEPKKVYVT